jgi:uncharacterized membrane protein
VGNQWDTGRIEAFSDGVFAIAITLLVLDIGVSEKTLVHHPWYGIGHQWPQYLAYLTSFLTIGALWMLHHGMFRRMRYANTTIMRINLLLLMFVSFLPYPTGLAAEAIRVDGAERAAVIFYGGTLTAISLVVAAMWRVVLRTPDLLEPGVTEEELRGYTRLTEPNVGGYVIAVIIAFVVPWLSALGYLVIAIASVFRTPGQRSSHSGTRPPRRPDPEPQAQ